MGLALHLDVEEAGLPLTLETTAPDGSEVTVDVDYSEALSAFVDTFLDTATSLVPVDTGYLESTIGAETDEESTADCYAEAEYAQYPEYGTWCQEAQPYFTPAIEEAWDEFCGLASEAVESAQQEMQDIVEAITEDMMEEQGAETTGMMSGFAMMVAMVVMFPVMLYVEGIKETFSDAFTFGGSSSSSSGDVSLEMPEIEIT